MTAPDPQRQELAREYARTQHSLHFLNLALEAVVLAALWAGGLSVRLADVLDPIGYWPRVAVYFVTIAAAFGVLALPLSYYGGFVLPRRFGLSTQRLGSWLADKAKGSALGLLLSLGMVLLVYWFMVKLPGLWWLASAAMMSAAGLLATYVAPLLIVPLFFKMRPLADVELRQRLMQLANRARARVTGIYTLDFSRRGTTANAALMGMGSTRRIVLGDTLLKGYSPDEIEVVLAHELGHQMGRDIAKLSMFQAAILVGAFFLSHLALMAVVAGSSYQGIADIAALPVLAATASVFLNLVGPGLNAYSRHIEAEADERALALTRKPQAFVSLMAKLTDQNLNEARPGRWTEIWFYSHPPYWKRVQRARRHGLQSVAGP